MIITSFLVEETLGAQTQQVGNNQIVFSNVPYSTAGYQTGGGDGTGGAGDSYINRRVLVNEAGTQQERIIVAQVAGTGTTQICTVHEDWDTNPVSTDTADVFYEYADMEDGIGSGITLNTKSGLYELARIITTGNGTNKAGLAAHGGTPLECADRGTADNFLVKANAYYRTGYYAGGVAINGAIITFTAASDDEPAMTYESGADCKFLDSLLWAQRASLTVTSSTGAAVVYDKTKLQLTTLECQLYGDTINDSSVVGKSLATEIARVDANTVCNAMTLVNVQALDTAADVAVETIELSNVIFSGVPGYFDVRQNKTINLIDPVWDVTTYTQLTWTGTSTGNVLNDRRSVIATIQDATGTVQQNALVAVYENTITATLALELVSDVNGLVNDSFIYKAHATNSVTTTYGGHALRIDKWLYLPFVKDQVSTEKVSGSFTIGLDSNIVQATQATAITDGAGIVWTEDTNPSDLIAYTGGSGTALADMIITFTPSGAVGTLTEIADGDSTAGKLHFKSRNATAIANGDTFSRTGGTAGTFSGTYTNASAQQFSIWIEANAKSYQTQHDYWAARTSETTLNTIGRVAHNWGRGQQARVINRSGASFSTNRSNGKGIYIVNGGAGTVGFMTDDNGGTFTPSASVTLTITVLDDSTGLPIATTARVYIADTATKTQIMAQAVDGSGVATLGYSYTVPVPIVGWAREFSLTGTDYVQKDFSGSITASGFSLTVRLSPI